MDESADFDMALDIIFNAKTQRIGVCNACESTLVHRNIAREFLPLMKKRLDEKNVEIRADEEARSIVPEFTAATEEDWGKNIWTIFFPARSLTPSMRPSPISTAITPDILRLSSQRTMRMPRNS